MENSPWELLIKFECDPMVGSKVMDLLIQYSGRGGASAPTDIVVVD